MEKETAMGSEMKNIDETDDMENGGHEESRLSNMKGIIVKGGAVLAIIALVIVLFTTLSTRKSRARFVLSDREIVKLDEDIESKTVYQTGDTVYFLVNRLNGNILNADRFIMEIGREEDGKYGGFKSISYDISKEFVKLRASIPSDYFSAEGKYIIKTYLDGKLITTNEITIK